MSSDEFSSSNERSSISSQESASDGIEVEIKEHKPSIFELTTLSNQFPYISEHIEFLEKLQSSNCIYTEDLILGCCGFAAYDEVEKFLGKKVKKTINSNLKLINDNLDTLKKDTCLFFCPRFVNIPLENVLTIYKNTFYNSPNFKYFISFSRVYALGKEELEESLQIFKEFKAADLQNFPYRSEEVFLLNSKIKANTEIDGTLFKIIIADRNEFEAFLQLFEKELEIK